MLADLLTKGISPEKFEIKEAVWNVQLCIEWSMEVMHSPQTDDPYLILNLPRGTYVYELWNILEHSKHVFMCVLNVVFTLVQLCSSSFCYLLCCDLISIQ